MGVKGFSDGEQSPSGEATGHLTALALPLGVVNKNQKLSKRNFMRKYSRTEANPKGLWRSLASGHQDSQGPNTQL